MPTLPRVAALAVMSLLLAGCAQETENNRAFTEPPPCNPGRGRPISEAALKAVFARHGIHLYRDDRCEVFGDANPDTPLATLTNSRVHDPPQSGKADIFCDLYRGGALGSRQRRATKLRRVKYKGDEETHLGFFNVECTIYPESPQQIDALEAVLRQLRNVGDN